MNPETDHSNELACRRLSPLRRFTLRIGADLRRAVPASLLARLWRPTLGLRRGNLVMFHVGRSGSTVLASLLQQHPDMYWDGELFDGDYRATEAGSCQRGARTRERGAHACQQAPSCRFYIMRTR